MVVFFLRVASVAVEESSSVLSRAMMELSSLTMLVVFGEKSCERRRMSTRGCIELFLFFSGEGKTMSIFLCRKCTGKYVEIIFSTNQALKNLFNCCHGVGEANDELSRILIKCDVPELTVVLDLDLPL